MWRVFPRFQQPSRNPSIQSSSVWWKSHSHSHQTWTLLSCSHVLFTFLCQRASTQRDQTIFVLPSIKLRAWSSKFWMVGWKAVWYSSHRDRKWKDRRPDWSDRTQRTFNYFVMRKLNFKSFGRKVLYIFPTGPYQSFHIPPI